MIDYDLVESLSEHIRLNVETALVVLVDSGIIESQLARYRAQALAGSETESDAVLMDKIRKFRAQCQRLESLKELGMRIKQEMQR